GAGRAAPVPRGIPPFPTARVIADAPGLASEIFLFHQLDAVRLGTIVSKPWGRAMLTAPLVPLIRLGNLFPDHQVFAQCEFLAPSGCFKIRGATHLLNHLQQTGGHRRLIVPSMGNTALGAAVGAKALNFAMTGVVPTTISRAKDEKLQALGVDLL